VESRSNGLGAYINVERYGKKHEEAGQVKVDRREPKVEWGVPGKKDDKGQDLK